MRTIHKYPLAIADTVDIQMPDEAQPLYVAAQRGDPYVWALVNTERDMVRHRFYVRGTGHDCAGTERSSYLGSLQLSDGLLVFHVFDAREPMDHE